MFKFNDRIHPSKLILCFMLCFNCCSVLAQFFAFVEEEGLLVIEVESLLDLPSGWADETLINDFTGTSYLRYAENNQFNNPGVDLMAYPIFIKNPGRYRFQWRNLIAEGTSNTEANDSWLRIWGHSFYGQKNRSNGQVSIVCPKGYDPVVNNCPEELDEDGGGVNPNGSGSNGWFKVFRSGSGEWIWLARTSDNDAHNIFVEFNLPGIYLIEISGRSKDHAIDRMVMYRDDYQGDPLDTDLNESFWLDVDLIFKNGYETTQLNQ